MNGERRPEAPLAQSDYSAAFRLLGQEGRSAARRSVDSAMPGHLSSL
jgi:hypothetical protein